MKFIVHSGFTAESIRTGLGRAEYSYYFVLEAFAPALRQLGEIVAIADPLTEVDQIFDQCQAIGEGCVFLCFAPPHLVPINLRCPTVPVIAWEFTSIPCVSWDDEPRHDWRVVLRHCGQAITLSGHTARLISAAMGPAFPVAVIAGGVFDRFGPLGAPQLPALGARTIDLAGVLIDTQGGGYASTPVWPPPPPPPPPVMPVAVPVEAPPVPPAPPVEPPPPRRPSLHNRVGLTAQYAAAWYRAVLRDLLPDPLARRAASLVRAGLARYRARRARRAGPPAALATEIAPVVIPPAIAVPPPPIPQHLLTLEGVVYVAVLSPSDGRKNWADVVSAFIYAFRDTPAATLVLKMTLNQAAAFQDICTTWLRQHTPFRCRVVLLFGFLEDPQYAGLIQAASYYVNASSGEGLCLPLMEFLCAAKPAIAPAHTAMEDYIAPSHAFVLRTTLEHTVWPHDSRDIFTTMRYRLDWGGLVAAYQASFTRATEDGAAYRQMAAAAQARMQGFCTTALTVAALRQILGTLLQSKQAVP